MFHRATDRAICSNNETVVFNEGLLYSSSGVHTHSTISKVLKLKQNPQRARRSLFDKENNEFELPLATSSAPCLLLRLGDRMLAVAMAKVWCQYLFVGDGSASQPASSKYLLQQPPAFVNDETF